MNLIPDNAIVVGVTVTLTYKLMRHMDRGNPKRQVLKSEHLRIDTVGSDELMKCLPDEMQRMGGVVMHDVLKWEGRAKPKEEVAA